MIDLIALTLICVFSSLYIWTLYSLPIVAVGFKNLRRNRKKQPETRAKVEEKNLPTVSIVVPAKNEERVIGRLLESLLKSNYPAQKKEIIIVEDGSTDSTVEICRSYMNEYPDQIKLLHNVVSNGKPSALNYACKQANGEIVAVFDADSVPESDVLLKAAEYFEDPSVAAIQGLPCPINADENRLTKVIAYEECLRFEVYMRGKDALDLFVPLTGNCCFMRRDILHKVGGWDEASLSEDMELSARLTEAGYRIKYASDLKCWQETPANFADLMKQRIRWLRGCMEVALKYGRLMSNLSWRNVDAEFTLVGPYMFAPCLLGYLMVILALLVPTTPNVISIILAQATTLFTLTTLMFIGTALIYLSKPRKISNVLWLPFIYAYWTFQSFMALCAILQIILRRPKRWTRTTKTGTIVNNAWTKSPVKD